MRYLIRSGSLIDPPFLNIYLPIGKFTILYNFSSFYKIAHHLNDSFWLICNTNFCNTNFCIDLEPLRVSKTLPFKQTKKNKLSLDIL